MPQTSKRRLRATGGYRKLRSFQTTTLIYDGTVSFCRRFVSGYSRTQDQMIQAARSGRQNIAEGNRAGAVSTKSELKLTNVARASLEELLLDFEDYLRQNKLPLWDPNGSEAQKVRSIGSQIRSAPEDSPPARRNQTDRCRRRSGILQLQVDESLYFAFAPFALTFALKSLRRVKASPLTIQTSLFLTPLPSTLTPGG